MTTLNAPASSIALDTHTVQCMEIWGGNEHIERALSVPGLDAWVYSSPYDPDGVEASGGDIHYVSTCGAGKVSRFMVADVSGHGEEASDSAHALRKLMRRFINTLDQTRFAREVNRAMSQSSSGRFATSLLATYFAPGNNLIICNAGHPPPLWYRASTGRWQFLMHDRPECLPTVANLPLGVVDQTDYFQFAVELQRGDVVLIYTDALIEPSPNGRQKNIMGAVDGTQALLELVETLDADDPSTIGPRLIDEITHARGRGQGQNVSDDDQTLMVLHHNASGPRHLSLGEKVHVMAKLLGLSRV